MTRTFYVTAIWVTDKIVVKLEDSYVKVDICGALEKFVF